MNNQNEIWKSVPGYEGLYEVSNLGNAKSLDRTIIYKDGRVAPKKGRILKPTFNKSIKYLYVSLSKEGKVRKFLMHQLVAMGFLGHTRCNYKRVINHLNENQLDNRVENLEVTSQRRNVLHSKKRKSKYPGVYQEKNTKNWRTRIYFEGKKISLGSYPTEEEAGAVYQNALAEIENK